ncbi:MAG: Flp pilus assembly protein CpaB [Propionibacteriaceae bacterium]
MSRRRSRARDPGELRLDGRRWPRPRLPRLATGVRWLAAAALVGLAAVLLSAGPAGTGEPTVAVLVAAHDLAPGVALRAGDLRTARLPRSLVPDGALRVGERTSGRQLAAPARRGQPLTDVTLMGPALLRASSAGDLVAAPVRVADPGTLDLVRPGDRVDVLAVRTDDIDTGSTVPPATVVARNVVLLSTGTTTDDSAEPGTLVVVAAEPGTAARLAADAVHSRLSLTVHGR